MKRSLRAAALALCLLVLQGSLTGCFGKFALTRKVYSLNSSVGDHFLRSILMFALVLVPVYQCAAFIDYVLFNVIEFWSGSNPFSVSEGQTVEKSVGSGDLALKLRASHGGALLRLELGAPGADQRVFTFERTEQGMSLRDGGGELLAALELRQGDDGAELSVRDRRGVLLLEKSGRELSELEVALRSGAPALLGTLEQQGAPRLAAAR